MNKDMSGMSCPDCGQAVLPGDSICWHCGAQLAAAAGGIPDEGSAESGKRSTADRLRGLQTLYYALMTAAVVIGLLLVIRSLGRQPRLSATFALSDTEALKLNAPDGSFSIDLPSDLLWVFPYAEGMQQEVRRMVGDPRFAAALRPLLGRAPDHEMLLLAQAESGVLALARSERLAGISVSDIVTYANNETFSGSRVLSARRGTTGAGAPIAILTVELTNPAATCRQHIMPTTEYAYLAGMCTNPGDFEEQAPTFNATLDSLTIR